MTNEEKKAILSRIDDLERELASLKDAVAADDALAWPQHGDVYYSIGMGGIVLETHWDDDENDNARAAIGNVFSTKEAAEFEAERLRVLHEMRRFAFRPDWTNDNELKCHIVFNMLSRDIVIGNTCTIAQNDIYFPCERAARDCIAAVGGDRIKKYYLRIQEEPDHA